MHKGMIRVCSILLLLILVLTLSSCNGEEEEFELEGINLVIIHANRANVPVLDDNVVGLIENRIERSFYHYGDGNYEARANVWYIVSDGIPSQRIITNVPVRAQAYTHLRTDIRNRARDLLSYIRNDINLRAQHEQADLLAALHEAAWIFGNLDSNNANYILILDSGITTVGHLNMREINMQCESSNGFAANLKEGGFLPVLNGVHVTFVGIGGVALPQTRPSSNHFDQRLQQLWRSILSESGVVEENIHFVEGRIAPTQNNDTDFPYVSIVCFDIDECEQGSGEGLLEELTTPPLVTFDEQTIGFLRTSYELVCEVTARSVIGRYLEENRVLDYLAQDLQRMIYVIGSESQATFNQKNPNEPDLSKKRAYVIRRILIDDFRIPINRIRAFGAGTAEFPWRNANAFPYGPDDPRDDIAALNRVVAILPNTSENFNKVRAFLESVDITLHIVE